MKVRIFGLLVLAMLLAACNRLTMENYTKIKSGMSYEEVTAILGNPSKCSEALGIRICTWNAGNSTINVNFVGEKVVLTAADNLR